VVITAGLVRKKSEARLELADRNVKITKEIVGNVMDYNRDALLLVANNPVDITTYAALKVSGLPRERVLGTGTYLDSLRFRFLLSEATNLDPESIEAIFIGEHGDSAVPVLSTATVNGLSIADVSGLSDEQLNNLIDSAKKMGQQLLELKCGSTFAPAVSITSIIDAIVNDQHNIMPLSVFAQGEYGLSDLCIGLPVRVGRNGIEKIIEIKLTEQEEEKLRLSAGILESEIANIK
jgi:L-lactate dehydrogenase